MAIMNLVGIIMVLAAAWLYKEYPFMVVPSKQHQCSESMKVEQTPIVLLLFVLFLGRAFLSGLYLGCESDMGCFSGWSHIIAEVGPSGFYKTDSFHDYPPGYMYILYIIGKLFQFIGVDSIDVFSIMVLKTPAMICDAITGYIIYRIARKRYSEKSSIFFLLIYMLNPVIILDSTIWGQVDSVFTLFVVLMCYYVVERKLTLAFVVYGIGILIKPQTIIFTPVLGLGCVEEVFTKWEDGTMKLTFHLKKLYYNIGRLLLAITIFVLGAFPFGMTEVLKQLRQTISSYDCATVNAYNMWAMFGLNWRSQSNRFLGVQYVTWGYLFIAAIIVGAILIFIKWNDRDSKYYLIGAFTVTCMFTFSVRMHERYLFPAIVLLLLTVIMKPSKRLCLVYCMMSILLYYNMAYVLITYPDQFSWDDKWTIVISIAMVASVCYFLYVIVKERKSSELHKFTLRSDKKGGTGMKFESRKKTIRPSERLSRLKKIDFILIAVITIIYACFALYDLGYRYAPQTQWENERVGDAIVLDLGEVKEIGKISTYLGTYENRTVTIQVADSLENGFRTVPSEEEDKGEQFTFVSVLRWNSVELSTSARYIKLVMEKTNTVIRELVLLDPSGNQILPVNVTDYPLLFDEQQMYDKEEGFRSGTYFDEIYHARTAYEYLNDMYSYENTHPPLGKVFIALGMVLFGVNPFGWRIIGTLFGIAMLPLIYIFAKRMFRKTWLATMACTLFAADFMHFAQTRIATIDVFITFFVILMYYFMYRYTRMSFYDTPLKKTFLPLALCGISMGLGVASKVTGAYAGLGLAVIFFYTLYVRYDEYCFAKETPEGETNGISHATVINSFPTNVKRTILFCVLVFVLVPTIIYTLSYIPFDDKSGDGLITQMINNQFSMFRYHTHVDATHPFSSWWYEWPLMTRPIWYYSNNISSTVAESISSFGNPIIWWSGIPAFVYLCYVSIREKDQKAIFLVVGYLAQYLPWVPVPRITFIYHYFPSVPFVIMMIAYCFYRFSKRNKRAVQYAIAFMAIACILFFLFYPVLSGQKTSKEYVEMFLKWLPGWVLFPS